MRRGGGPLDDALGRHDLVARQRQQQGKTLGCSTHKSGREGGGTVRPGRDRRDAKKGQSDKEGTRWWAMGTHGLGWARTFLEWIVPRGGSALAGRCDTEARRAVAGRGRGSGRGGDGVGRDYRLITFLLLHHLTGAERGESAKAELGGGMREWMRGMVGAAYRLDADGGQQQGAVQGLILHSHGQSCVWVRQQDN